ncbi:chitin-inducible gibberellin-responsive protein 1-like [Aristolochia californica]|uniref:chitin-inducible gibberellin-responsive protein 1-like n=1 Tax=Aristolochia californica TaxID=171875 RepID=UPI0035D6A1D7
MDSHLHPFFRCNVPGLETSYDFTSSNIALHAEWLFSPMKFKLESSPDSPLLNDIDYGTFSTLSNGQEQYSSTENHSAISTSQNLSLDTDSSFQHSQSKLQKIHPNYLVGRLSHEDHAITNIKNTLQEIESALMAPDSEETSTPSSAFNDHWHRKISTQQHFAVWNGDSHQEISINQSPAFTSRKHHKVVGSTPPSKRQKMTLGNSQDSPCSDVKQLLIQCASALAENRMTDFEELIQEARSSVSISGTPIQRFGAYIVEGLVARKEDSGTNIYNRALRCKEPEREDLLSYMQILYEICPYFKFGYMAANGAIAEAFKNEDRVHIIDFQIAQGIQWVALIQALAARPSGPPHVRITGIDDPVSQYARGDGLEAVGKRLAAMSKKFNILVEFHPIPVFASEVKREMLDIRPGEALAVNFTLQLHHTPDESVDVNNPRDGLLRMVKSLSPKVTTLVEQESNTNTTPFFTRFIETLDFYSAMFESIDETLPRDNRNRINVEQQCLARDIVNIIACEKKDRVERHELLGKWKSRFTMAGFQPFPLSSYVNSVIKSLLKSYSENYTLVEKDGTLLLGWKDRHLISASAWH